MEWASKVMSAATRASNNNTVINVLLVGAFVALSMRSVKQQRDIEALESQKDTLLVTNKAMKKSMWDWKQQLFNEASSPDTATVPLSKLKAIYGESLTTPQPMRNTKHVSITWTLMSHLQGANMLFPVIKKKLFS